MTTPNTADVRSFMAGMNGNVHPAWDSTLCSFDPVQNRYVSDPRGTPIRQLTTPHTDHFLKALDLLKEQRKDVPGVAGFNIRGSHSWNDVLTVAGQATDHYQSKAKGFRGLLPKLGRKLGDTQPAIDGYLDMLPQGDYSSIVCGAVKLIFRATASMADVRKKVLETLAASPELLEQTEMFLKMYSGDRRLNERAVQLYVALLLTIEAVIKWLNHGFRERLKALVFQDMYGRFLEDKIGYLRGCTASLREQAEMCDKNTTLQSFDSIQEMLRQLATVQSNVSDIKNDVGKVLDKQSSQEEATNALSKTLLQSQAGILDWMKRLDMLQARLLFQSEMQNLREIERARTPTFVLPRQEVLRLLGTDGQEAAVDTEHYIKLARMQDTGPEIPQKIMTSPTFQSWFGSASSQLLFVAAEQDYGRFSALSCFSASLARLLVGLKPAIALTFFCDRHVGFDLLSGPGGLLASISAQFLNIRNAADLAGWAARQGEREHYECLTMHDTAYLSDFFGYLITSLAFGAVYVLVDGFRALENNSPPEELSMLLQSLRELVDVCQANGNIMLKVIIMGLPMRDLQYIPGDAVLSIDTQPERYNRQLTPREMEFQMLVARRRGGP